jgi:hypothetical protein
MRSQTGAAATVRSSFAVTAAAVIVVRLAVDSAQNLSSGY